MPEVESYTQAVLTDPNGAAFSIMAAESAGTR